MDNYLNTDKSIIISSPAGSGKTEKLSRRYIALLQSGVDVERVLAITFTDKAAAEMKQRILKILKEEDGELFKKILEKMPLMRVTTIHSFCGTLLRRFSFEADIDPNYRVEDAIDSRIVWEEVLYEIIMDAGRGESGHDLLLQTLSEKGFRGLDYLRNIANYLFQKSPFSFEAQTFRHSPAAPDSLVEELKSWPGVKEALEDYEYFFDRAHGSKLAAFEKYFLTDKKEPRKKAVPSLKAIIDYRDWASKMYMYWKDRKIEEHVSRTERIREIYKKCLGKYNAHKRARGALDFSDLEYITYRMLTENPEWANILYAFDEKTDHILVDEFQDTNNFQWAIIDKLTEEWRSGQGPKRDEGIRPTVFFVGDEKQSIYFFRGANVEIFRRARIKLDEWLGEEFCYEEVKENYRSLPAIIEFTNIVFSNIMHQHERSFPWVTEYTSFHPYKKGIPNAGHVELVLLDEGAETAAEKKRKESTVLAQRIRSLVNNFLVTDSASQQQRPCQYSDMAILLRKRTHLGTYEEALRELDIPFVAVKGIGFYQEPEVAMLRAFLFFLSNPRDDYSLYTILKSPLFHIEEHDIIKLISNGKRSLFSELKEINSEKEENIHLNEISQLLQEWLSMLTDTPLSQLLEHVLVSTGAWKYFHEAQRRANIKKFIRLVEDLEANGKSLFKIRDFLERTSDRNDEPKANVNTEGMDAVQVMTVHASKGLEFPIVFVPGLDDQFILKTDDRLVYEKEGRFFFKSEPISSIRKQDDDFLIQLAKEEEEQKRLFYVAVTRAEEALFLISHWTEKDKNFLDFLKKSLEIEKKDSIYTAPPDMQVLSLITEEDVKTLFKHAPEQKKEKKVLSRIESIPLAIKKPSIWKSVTETVDIKREHGKDWGMLGDIIHKLYEEISNGIIVEQDIFKRAQKHLSSRGIMKDAAKEKIEIIENQVAILKGKDIWQKIIKPQKDSFTELPFIFKDADTVYNGRIDRIIKQDDQYRVYDYKTFPVHKKEMNYLLKEYAVQLHIYKNAVKNIFNTENVNSYIIFTHSGEVQEV